MTPHAQEPTPVYSTALHGQRGAPGLAVYASHTVVSDGSLFEKEQGGQTFSEPHGAARA